MKKILFAMAALLGCATVSFAQTSFIATLQHEGEFTHYYGAGALTSAYNAAATGDIITLSPGTFTSPGTINKSITVRGTGIESVDSTWVTGRSNLTFVSGDVTFQSTDSTFVTTIEGIRFINTVIIQNNSSENGQGTIKFIKDYVGAVNATAASSFSIERGPKVRFYDNIIYDFVFKTNSYPDYLIYNSFVKDPRWDGTASETTTTFVNCVIKWQKDSYRDSGSWGVYGYYPFRDYSYYINYYNCIFNSNIEYSSTSYRRNSIFPNTTTCMNCLSINEGSLFNNLVSGANNKTVGSVSDVFKTYNSDAGWKETFELTDAAKEAYIGTDGTQIGMQGGNYPYTTTVQYPIITKFKADAQTNKAGILNVDVEVDGK